MSKGQQKQAAFWLALCTMPDYLILDEPVDGLDPVMRRQVWSLILQDVAERGTTVLVSSHNLRELEDVCDHVGVMSRGKLLLEHSLSELQDYTVKLQLAFEGAELPALPQEIKVLHHAQTGRVHTLICRGSAEELEQQLTALHPIFIDAVPLSLEEIFIYELGGEDYAIRDIVL
jgi:ABC-2 type transport system ATP-binding protein